MKKIVRLLAITFIADKLNSRITIYLGLLTILISGCTLGPDFIRPKSPEVKSYLPGKSSTKITTTSSESVKAQSLAMGKDIEGQWWTLFRSPALTKLIELTIKHNPDLQTALATLNQAQENATAKQGSLFPSLDVITRQNQQRITGAQFGDPNIPENTYALSYVGVHVAYTLDVFGAIRRQIEGFEAIAEYNHFQLEGIFLTLAANVVTTAIQEASLRAQIKATQEIIFSQTRQLDLVTHQFELGGSSKIDVLALQANLEQTQATLPPLQQQLAQTRHQLTVFTGELPGNELIAQFNLNDLHLPEELPLSLPSKLVEQRPDIRAQEALLHDASAQIGVATARLFPDFTIDTNVGSVATKIGDLFVPGSAVWNLAGNMLAPVFHGGEYLHKRRAALAAYEEAAARYRSTVLQAFQNVADTLSALESDAAKLKAQDAALKAAFNSLELTKLQYQVGAISYLPLLTSERDYQQAQIGQVKAHANRYADTAALLQSLGGGWWNRKNLSTALVAEQTQTKKQ